MTVFNKNNTGHKEGYPLFLGQDLGIIDTINVQYPQLEELYQTQISQIWNEFEIDLTQDRMDMLKVPDEIKQLMVDTLMFQTAADSIAASSIVESLGKYITNTECLNLATVWSFFEVIHSRTYSHIIKQTFIEPNDMIEELYNNSAVLNRIDIITKTFDEMEMVNHDDSDFTKKCAILNTLTALFGMEAISFMSSFAITFGITQMKVFQGIGQLVKLICRDEVLHAKFSFELFKILLADPEWSEAFEATKNSRLNILNTLLNAELDNTDALFNKGGKIIGLNAELLKEYVVFMSKPVFDLFKFDISKSTIVTVPKTTPLPYMESYIDSSQVQAAAQEIQLTNYNIGVIADDNVDDIDFDF